MNYSNLTIKEVQNKFNLFHHSCVSQHNLAIYTSNNIGLLSIHYSISKETIPICKRGHCEIETWKKTISSITGYLTSETIIEDKTFNITVKAWNDENQEWILKLLKVRLIKNQDIKPNEKVYFTAEEIIPWTLTIAKD